MQLLAISPSRNRVILPIEWPSPFPITASVCCNAHRQTSLLCNTTLPRALTISVSLDLFIEHWEIEKRHGTVFIEGRAISSFSKILGPDVVVCFSSLASSISVSWVTSETNI